MLKDKIGSKKQSILITRCAVFFITSSVFAYLYFYGDTKNVILKKYSLLNPARNLYNRGDLIVNVQPLREELTKIGVENPGLSVYFEYLPTGANISVNKEVGYFPASLLKLPAAFAVYKKVEEGEWKMSDKFEITEDDKEAGFGQLYKKPVGTKMTVKDLLFEMLAKSDNTAYMVFVNHLKVWDLNEAYGHVGMDSLVSSEGLLTTKKYSVFLRSLYNSSYLKDDSSQDILGILTDNPFREYLAQSLPMDIVFAHKIGENQSKRVHQDAGIVYVPNRPYLITVMIKDTDENTAKKLMWIVSKKVYDYISSYKEE